MVTNFIEELKWRGMLHSMTPGAEELLNKGPQRGYIGFDPTSDSLGIGNLVQVMTLLHFQNAGHLPIALLGGATGLVGDPSGKTKERQLLDFEQVQKNIEGQKKQIEKLLAVEDSNVVKVINNYNWFESMTFLEFIRDVGKHITVNYMMAKESVKKRIETGLSFTEFSYQLIQAYDFYMLYQQEDCFIQLGGSDQWGNIMTGIELIRRKLQKEAHGVTTQLIKKADGTKFGKTESGNVWLDPDKTSPYEFYQFWIRAADEDAKTYIKIFSTKSQEEIEDLIASHDKEPHLRKLQQALAEEITTRVHSKEDFEQAYKSSKLIFSSKTPENWENLTEEAFLNSIQGAPEAEVSKEELLNADIPTIFSSLSGFLPSKGAVRRLIKQNAISINRKKIKDESRKISQDELLFGKYLLLQRGKKTFFLLKIS